MAAQANYEATKGANGVSISLGSSLSARDSADTTLSEVIVIVFQQHCLFTQEIKMS